MRKQMTLLCLLAALSPLPSLFAADVTAEKTSWRGFDRFDYRHKR